MTRRILLFLLLGFLINLAVTWTVALRYDSPSRLGDREPLELVHEGEFKIRGGLQTRRAHAIAVIYVLPQAFESQVDRGGAPWPRWVRAMGDDIDDFLATTTAQEAMIQRNGVAFGFPMLCAWCERYRWSWPPDRVHPPAGAFDLSSEPFNPRTFSDRRLLPYRPIWTGLVVNTVSYASAAWLGLLGPWALRRMLRRRCGRCVRCRYDLRATEGPVCPECGAPSCCAD